MTVCHALDTMIFSVISIGYCLSLNARQVITSFISYPMITELKKARLRSPLTVDDVRMLLKQKCWSSISKMETGKRFPTLDTIIGYHVLFGIPLEELLKREIEQFKLFLEGYAQVRIDEIAEKSNGVNLAERIYYLQKFTEQG